MPARSRTEIAGEDIIATDWKFNFRLDAGRVRCHGAGDIVWGTNRDWARTSGAAALLQKLVIYFAIPKGEVIGDPELGCCLHNYLFDKLTENTRVLMEMEMEHELKSQIPELGVHKVSAEKTDSGSVKLTILGYNTWLFNVSREDLLDINLLDVFGGAS